MSEISLNENRAFLTPERLEGKTYEQYKVRRKAGNDFVKHTRTEMFWDSYYKVPYVKEISK